MVTDMNLWRNVGDDRWVGNDASERFPIYTRGNAGEVYPEVFRPLSFSIAQSAGERAMRNAFLASGFIRPEEIADVPLTVALGSGTFGGYVYLNLSLQRTVSARVPGGDPLDADASFLGSGDAPPHVAHPGEKNRRASVAGMRYIWRLTKITELPQLAIDQQIVDRYLTSLPDPATAPTEAIRGSTTGELMDVFAELFETHLKVSFAAGAMFSLLTKLCEDRLGDGSIALRLVSGLGDVDSAAPSTALWSMGRRVAASDTLSAEFDEGVAGIWRRLQDGAAAGDDSFADFVDEFTAFVAEFGSRGPNEWDTAFDTWETDPELALTLVDRMRFTDPSHAPGAQGERLAAEREALEQEVLAKIKWPLRKFFVRILASARLHMSSRERTKTTVVRAIHGSRLQAHELDRRMVEQRGGQRGDLWFLVDDELDAYVADPTSCSDIIAERRATHAELQRRVPPFYFDGQQPPLDQWELRDTHVDNAHVGEVITGLPGCAGVARGRARVVIDPSDPRGLEPGDVLIAPLTDPSWTPLFVPAEAVVVDVGAPMSHAVIVSRELGIPCAVSVHDATRRIPDGALIEVDGGAGTVTVIEVP